MSQATIRFQSDGSMLEGRKNSAQRTFAGVAIGNCGQFGVPDQRDIAGGPGYGACHTLTRSLPRNGSRALSRPIRELRPPASTYPEQVTRK